MKLVQYNPLVDLEEVENDLDKFWGNSWSLLPSIADSTTMDLYEMDGKIVAEVSLTNFKKDEVKVTTDKGVLEISAEHKEKEEDENKKRYYLRESSSHYLRRVSLPKGTQTDKVGAEFKDGILKVTMPVDMPTKSKAKEVHIK